MAGVHHVSFFSWTNNEYQGIRWHMNDTGSQYYEIRFNHSRSSSQRIRFEYWDNGNCTLYFTI